MTSIPDYWPLLAKIESVCGVSLRWKYDAPEKEFLAA
jgi:hypothetical protein